MDRVRFTIYGKPQGKGRPRFTRSGHTYTPRNTQEYENSIVSAYLSDNGGFRFGANIPLLVTIRAVFAPPTSISGAKRAKMLSGEYPTKKPDIDNICKVFMDAMNGVVYEDDKQVVAVAMKKVYGETACVQVEVEEVI